MLRLTVLLLALGLTGCGEQSPTSAERDAQHGATQVQPLAAVTASVTGSTPIAPVAATVAPATSDSVASVNNSCGKDTDCKGDRICEAGVCINPPEQAVAVSAQARESVASSEYPAADDQPAVAARTYTPLPDVDALQQALIAAMSWDALTQTRLGDSGAAIRAYANAGLVDIKPAIRMDYSDYRRFKQPAPFLGHELVVIEEEYMAAYVGCCVSPGVAILVKLYPDGVNLGEFIQGRGCSLNADVSHYADIPELQLPPLRYGSFVEISCKERDSVSY